MRRAREHLEPRAGDPFGELAEVLGRRRRVALARDRERRRLDARQRLACIPGRERLAAARVALRVDREEHLPPARIRLLDEPPVENRVDDRPETRAAPGRGAVEPLLRVAEAGRGTREHELLDTLWHVESELHADRPAEREPDEVEALGVDLV